MFPTKDRDVLKAHPSQQAQSKHLRAYAQIKLLEQGKVLGGYRRKLTKNNKQLNEC